MMMLLFISRVTFSQYSCRSHHKTTLSLSAFPCTHTTQKTQMTAEQTREFFVDAIAGWVAGASSTVCVQPVDTILTRVQSASIPSSFAAAAANTTTTSTSSSLSSRGGSAVGTGTTRNVLQSVFRDGGYKAFFRGLPAATMVIPLQNMLLFVGYGRRAMEQNIDGKEQREQKREQ